MNISCTKDALQQAVQTVQKAIASKTPMPILTGIYLSAHNGRLELQATDYEIGISCTIDANIVEEGNTVLSGRYFQEMVRKLPGDSVSLISSDDSKTMTITAGPAQFNLLNLPPDEFPVLKRLQADTTMTVKDNVLKELIKRTVFACSTDEARPIFTGALLEVNEDQVTMVATNTHRLSIKHDRLDHSTAPFKMIIPGKILSELARLLVDDIPTDVTLAYRHNQVSFAFNDVYIISRLIEGQFPDYNRVIPESFATKAKLPADAFQSAVERVSLLAKDGDYNVIKMSFTQGEVVITSNNPDVGKAYEAVPIELEGSDVEIAFNARYVTDILKNVDCDSLLFSLNTPLSAASVRPLDDETYDYIVTPVRTN